jgi:hypothetical protein
MRQLGVLTRAFLARFFENEAAGTTTDAREGFFWLIAALGTPGIFLPLWMYFRWAEVAAIRGLPSMHVALLFDQTIYLGITAVGVALLTAMVWHTLIIERRDALILGSLPVRRRTVTIAKLAALTAYIALISVGMHGIAALLYGFGLSSLESWDRLLRFTTGQMSASVLLNCFVFFAIVGAQNAVIAIVGPRRFARVSSLLQVGVVGAGVGLLLLLPFMVGHADALAERVPAYPRAMDWLPPVWFLGLHQVVSGTDAPAMGPLAARALVGTGAALALTLVSFPIAGARIMRAAVEGQVTRQSSQLTHAARWLVAAIGLTPQRRGALQFTLAALARTHQQRLILAVTVGAGLAIVMPAAVLYLEGANLGFWTHRGWRPPPVSLVAAPLLWNFVIVCGMRAAMALPSELPAAWLFSVAPAPMFVGRHAARSLLVLPGVILPLAVAALVWYRVWPAGLVTGALVAEALAMMAVVDGALWGFVGIPCAKPLTPHRSGLASRWPALLVVLYVYAYLFPQWLGAATVFHWVTVLIPPALLFAGVHAGSKSAARANALSGDPHGYLTLDLNVTTAQLHRSVPHA